MSNGNPGLPEPADKVIDQKGAQVLVVALVWQCDQDGTEKVAIVKDETRRWILPQVRVDTAYIRDKSVISAKLALGYSVELHRIIQITYESSDVTAPLRMYWHGRALGTPDLSSEADWVSPAEAVRRLESPDDQTALSSYLAVNPQLIEINGRFARSFIVRRITSPHGMRLLGELRRVSARFSTYTPEKTLEHHYEAARFLLAKALTSFYQSDYDGSWKCLTDAVRRELFLLDETGLSAQRAVIQEQGKKKLDGWRGDAFSKIMKLADDDLSAELLSQASALISDFQETRYYGIRLIQRQVNIIVVMLVLSCTLFILNSYYDAGDFTGMPERFGVHQIISSFLLGALGACVSTLISLAGPQKLQIPDRLVNSVIAFARPFVGGGSALISSFFLLSNIIQPHTPSLAFMYVIAFAFGFSERLVLSTIEKFGKP